MMKTRSRFSLAVLLPLFALMPACGGGGDGLTRAVVTVRAGVGANLAGIQQLRVEVSSSGGNVTLNIPETPRAITLPTTFSVNFPKDRTGLATFNVTALDASNTALASNSGMVTLVAGESVNLEIFLGGSPPMDGGVDAAVDDGGTVIDGAPADAPAEAALTLTPMAQNYGNVVNGNSASQTFTVMNVGGTTSGIPALTVTGADMALFVLENNMCASALAPGQSCTVGVKFTPTTTGAKSATLTAAATPGGTVTATLTGAGIPPSALTFTPTSLNFGNQLVGSTSGAMTVTVRNTGGAASGAITIALAGTSAGDYGMTTTCTGMTLAPNATCTVSVTFQPTTRGSKSASLSLTATPGGPTTASLLGNGQSPALLSLSPTSTTFADQNISTTSAARSFTLTNSGDITSSVPTVTLAGANANQFAISSNACTSGVANGFPCVIGVTFTPTTVGAKIASLNVAASSGGSPTASLAGTGLAPGDANLIHHWKFENTVTNSGTAAGFTLTIPAGISYGAGRIGQAAVFGGGQYSYVDGLRATLGTYARTTIAWWMKEPGNIASIAIVDINKRSGTAPYGGIQFGATGAMASVCVSTLSATYLGAGCDGFTFPAANTWHHYVIRYAGTGTNAGQGGTTEIYVDNVLVHTRANDAANDPVFNATGMPDRLYIGAPGTQIDEFKIYDRVFTNAEQCTRVIGGTYAGTTCTLP